jgi:neurotransmitter:Na+ symporter, NSS family
MEASFSKSETFYRLHPITALRGCGCVMAREEWSSTVGFVLASIGSAVGIGNIWRFPYIVGVNGGGAFLIPYLIAVFLFSLPLMILELSVGRHFQTSVVPSFRAIGRRFQIVGAIIILIVSLILSYYLVITGWVLAYSIFFLVNQPIPFDEFTASYYPLLFFFVSGVAVFGIVRAGVKQGIESIARFLIPVLLILLFVLLAFSLSLPGALDGVAFYLTPDLGKLADPLVWVAAFGQSFFSLSVGMGILLTYGSYLRAGNLVKNAVTITVSDLFIALLSGFVIFPMVFSFGLDPTSGVNLAFVTLPPVFQEIQFGIYLGAAFFLLLFFAAITSAVSMLEGPVATLIDLYGIERKRASLIAMSIIIVVGLLSALSYSPSGLAVFGQPILDVKDLLFGTIGLIVSGILLSVIVGWFMDPDIITREIGTGRTGGRIFLFLIRIAIPAVLLVNLAIIVI